MDRESRPVLGKKIPTPQHYTPHILRAIERAEYPYYGLDQLLCFDFMYCDENGLPQAVVVEITVSRNSRYMIESKSLKLYLHSFWQCSLTKKKLQARIKSDLEKIVQTPIFIALQPADKTVVPYQLQVIESNNALLQQAVQISRGAEVALCSLPLRPSGGLMATHLYRSLCPVTGQPDWATIVLQGKNVPQPQLWLGYLLQQANDSNYHENIIDVFCEKLVKSGCNCFTIQGLFQRRGGICINPFRSDVEISKPEISRTYRQ